MEDLSGSVVDKYQLIRRIGAGGMGVVYEAKHTLIGRRCAVKLLHARHAQDAELAKRMLREAQAAAAIGHPNIVETTDFGVTADGAHYLVMELLEGVTLTRLLEAFGRLDVALSAGINWQVLGALEAAHAKGIIHRDLKPENVFIARTPFAGDVVKLLDFGISKVLDAESESARLTGTGAVLGTPHYMSPEQAAGSRNADARSDLWSVGVMLYELLTGQLPFAGSNYNQIIVGIVTRSFTPPRALRPDLSPALESVVMCALDKDPTRRFQSAGDMRAALSGHLGGMCDTTGRLRLPPDLLDRFLSGVRKKVLATSAGPVPAPPPEAPPPEAPPPEAPRPEVVLPVPSTQAAPAPPQATSPSPPSPPEPPGHIGSPPGDTIGTQPRGQMSVQHGAPSTLFTTRGHGITIGIGVGIGVLLLVVVIVAIAVGSSDGDQDGDKKKARRGPGSVSSRPSTMRPALVKLTPIDPTPIKPALVKVTPIKTTPIKPALLKPTPTEPAPKPKQKPRPITVLRSVTPKGAVVSLDGKRRRHLPLKIQPDGRKHVLIVKAAGYSPRIHEFVASESFEPLTVRLRWRRRPPRRPPSRQRPSMGYLPWK